MNENFLATQAGLFNKKELYQISLNAIEASFLNATQKIPSKMSWIIFMLPNNIK